MLTKYAGRMSQLFGARDAPHILIGLFFEHSSQLSPHLINVPAYALTDVCSARGPPATHTTIIPLGRQLPPAGAECSRISHFLHLSLSDLFATYLSNVLYLFLTGRCDAEKAGHSLGLFSFTQSPNFYKFNHIALKHTCSTF